ncbi:hypothetical protein NMG60_11028670 [Bertholletia excelsa]
MKRSVSDKMLSQRQKKTPTEGASGKNRLLITVNVLGSAGPIRFVGKEDDVVSAVIDTALKLYTREGRLPVLDSDVNNFLLYPANAGSDALSPTQSIGSCGVRNFVLCKKQRPLEMTETRPGMVARKGNGKWKTWLNKSFSFKF